MAQIVENDEFGDLHGRKFVSSRSDSIGSDSIAALIGHLWKSGPGAIEASPSSCIDPDSKAQDDQVLALRFWVVTMVLAGGAVDYVVDIYTEIVRKSGIGKVSSVFIVTAFSFLASALPPSLSRADRDSVREVNSRNPYFKYKVLIPGMGDLVITSARYAAILYISPAIVSMLKTSTQLVVLTFIQHFRGKRINCKAAICLVLCVVGLCIVTYSGMGTVHKNAHQNTSIGLGLALSSGCLGAVRNVLEEVILQGDDLSTGGLLLSESWISLVFIVVAALGGQASQGQLLVFLQELQSVLAIPAVWLTLAVVGICTYGKDFGKLFVVKHGNALISKTLTMLFPIVTWICALLTFIVTDGQFGEGLEFPSSVLRLLGFAIIACASISFVVLQQKKK